MKKLSKFGVLAFLVVAACLALAACGSQAPTPKQTVESALKAVTTHDYEALKGYYAGDVDKLTQEATEAGQQQGVAAPSELTEEQQARVKAVFDKLVEFDYTVGEETIDGDTATVNVTFTNYDVGTLAASVLQETLSTAFAQAFSGEEADEAAVADSMIASMEKATQDMGEKNVTKEAQVKLVKESDGTWKLASFEDDSEYASQLVNAMFGGVVDKMTSWADELTNAFNGLDSAAEGAQAEGSAESEGSAS